ncbi:MAG TPA: 50S ribosomal protein L24 [Clostridiales bacterium]|nr:50S ribosomal protein L24 [Clostridiales bacterium]
MKIKKNDTVLVLSGKDAGKTAKVLVAIPRTGKVVVDGVNVQKRHTKAKNAQEVSEIKTQSGAIDASNVMVVCPACGKATRVAYNTVEGKKVRVCKKCGASLEVAAKATEKKAVKKAAKASDETATKKTTAKKTTTKAATKEKTAAKKTTKKAATEEKTATKKTTKKTAKTADAE